MRVKVKEVSNGIHPNEVVVSILTKDGEEKLVVHRRSISNGGLEVGYPIFEENGLYLIELPRESMRGLWRIWVQQENVYESTERQFA